MTEPVRVFAPASVGNLACGFDVLGLALERLGDRVVARLRAEPGVEITAITGDGGRLPRDARRNAAGVAAAAVLRAAQAEREVGVALELHKGLPLSSGLGGSAASAVAGAVATDALLQARLPRELLLACAGAGEAGGAAAAHFDNAAPCLFGGICLVLPPWGALPPRVVELPVPPGLALAVVHPRVEIRTSEARRMLGETVPLRDAVIQWGNTAGVVAALHRGDLDLLSRAMVDVVAEPVRASLVPGFHAVREAALEAGALASSLSGSGPSVFALCGDDATARRAGSAMREAFGRAGVEAELHLSGVDRRGARILGREEE